MRIYISGPMTGRPEFNYPAFHAVAAELRAAGHHVENPAENHEPECKSWSGYMRLALAQLVFCEAIYMLKGWERSNGARIEFDLAKALNIELMFENGAASGHSRDEMEPVAYVLGDPRYADSSNVFMSHQFTPDGEHEDEWTPLFTAAAITMQAAAVLKKPARVGAGTFHIGVPERLVIEAAQRHYVREKERELLSHEQMIDHERKRRDLWDMVNGPLDSTAVPVAWRHSQTYCLYETEEDVPLADADEWAEPLFLRPAPTAKAERVMSTEHASAIIGINSALHRLQSGDHASAIEPLLHAKSMLSGADPADALDAEAIATAICQRVSELDDRNSPRDWPEAMLVTGDELHLIARESVTASVVEERIKGQELPLSTLLKLESGFFAGRWIEAEQLRALVECCKDRFGQEVAQEGGAA